MNKMQMKNEFAKYTTTHSINIINKENNKIEIYPKMQRKMNLKTYKNGNNMNKKR